MNMKSMKKIFITLNTPATALRIFARDAVKNAVWHIINCTRKNTNTHQSRQPTGSVITAGDLVGLECFNFMEGILL